LGLYKTRKIISFTDASGFEQNVKNPTPGAIAGFFSAPRHFTPFAFCIPWQAIRVFLPANSVFDKPHINYLELMTPIILFIWLCLFFPNFVKNHEFIIKIDSKVAQFWINNGRVSTFPFCSLLQLLAIFEWRYNCKVTMIYIKGTKNPADALSRKPFWEPRVFTHKLTTMPIKTVPQHVINLIVKALSGKLNWEAAFHHTSDRYTFDRPNRFHPSNMVFSTGWEFQLRNAMDRAIALPDFPQLSNN
jgi:hypothetical protein